VCISGRDPALEIHVLFLALHQSKGRRTAYLITCIGNAATDRLRWVTAPLSSNTSQVHGRVVTRKHVQQPFQAAPHTPISSGPPGSRSRGIMAQLLRQHLGKLARDSAQDETPPAVRRYWLPTRRNPLTCMSHAVRLLVWRQNSAPCTLSVFAAARASLANQRLTRIGSLSLQSRNYTITTGSRARDEVIVSLITLAAVVSSLRRVHTAPAHRCAHPQPCGRLL